MSMLSLATLLVCVVAVLADPDSCKVDGKTFKVGEQHDVEGHCLMNVCKGNDEWTEASCGLLGVPLGWTITSEDGTKPYPECCAKPVPPMDIVPDVLPRLNTSDYLYVTYEDGVKVDMGNELTPTKVKNQPTVEYGQADEKSWYLLGMVDPDAPSRKNPEAREFLHWLVGNIPGKDVASGDVLAEYIGSGPPKDSGLHRYVFLLYKQPEKLVFNETRVSRTSAEHRPKFSISNFAQKYKLGEPQAINVYQAEYDDSVPELHKQLGIKH